MALKVTRDFLDGRAIYYRPGTDYEVLREVMNDKVYYRKRIGWAVEEGEHWLDLGANIGAFALFCFASGATADCFEPDPECYKVLKRNINGIKGTRAFRKAVSNDTASELPFFTSSREGHNSRGTLFKNRLLKPSGKVPNVHGSRLPELTLIDRYDGIKMDIEGGEFGLIDDGLLPPADKLVLEYHTSRDKSIPNLAKRIKILESLYEVVTMPPHLRRLAEQGHGKPPHCDRLIFCKGYRGKGGKRRLAGRKALLARFKRQG